MLAKGLANLVIRFIISYIDKSAAAIVRKINSIANFSNGITVSLVIRLPPNFMKTVLKISPLQLPSIMRLIAKSSFSIGVQAGYAI